MEIAIIGGTGFYGMEFLETTVPQVMRTPFGSMTLWIGSYHGRELGFLPRHGLHHDRLAHEVNYRANLWGLRDLGVTRVLGVSAVGSYNPGMPTGTVVVPDQLVDFSHQRAETFNLGSVDMTEPYCPEMRAVIVAQADALQSEIKPHGTYLSMDGPRYETAAERRLYGQLGMDIVGMTNGTEAVLAREIGLCYATIAMVSGTTIGADPSAGAHGIPPDLEAHRQVVRDNVPRLRALALAAVEAMPAVHGCRCYSLRAEPKRPL